MGIRGPRWRPTRAAVLWARVTAVLGLLSTVAVGTVVAAGQQRAAEMTLQRRVDDVTSAVTTQTGRYIDTVTTVAAALGAVPKLTAAAFRQVAAPVAGMDLAGATSLTFLAPVDTASTGAEQQKWRSRGIPDLVLNPSPSSTDHIYAIFRQPLDGTAARPVGNDVAEVPELTAALRQAQQTGTVSISDPYILLRDRQLAPEQQQKAFVLAAAVQTPTHATAGRLFRGWVVMGLRSSDFLGEALDQSSGYGVDVTLRATTGNGVWTQVTSSRPTIERRADVIRRAEIPVAGRRWSLDIDASTPSLTRGLPQPVLLAGGLLLSLLAAALVLLRATCRDQPDGRAARAQQDHREDTTDPPAAEQTGTWAGPDLSRPSRRDSITADRG